MKHTQLLVMLKKLKFILKNFKEIVCKKFPDRESNPGRVGESHES